MKILNEKEPLGPLDKSNVNDPRNFKAKDPNTLNRINTALHTAPPSPTTSDVPSHTPSTPPRPIPNIPPKVTSTEHLSLIHI